MMKKTYLTALRIAFLLSLSLCLTLPGGTARAAASADTADVSDTGDVSDVSYVVDLAGLFSNTETDRINTAIQNLKTETDMDYMVCTTNDAEGKTAQEYADDAYEASGLGTHGNYSGLLYLIDMDNREIYLSTEGDMIPYLTDARIDTILDNAYEEIVSGNYAESALSVLQDAKRYIKEDAQEAYAAKEKGFPFLALGFGAAAGLVSALAAFFFIRSRYRLTYETYHYPLSEKSSLKLTISEDHLVNRFVTHRRIQKNPPSSGGHSTTHHSASGRVHGGGGRKF